jgi:hypothetical protein
LLERRLGEENGCYHPDRGDGYKHPDANSSGKKCEHDHHARAANRPLIRNGIGFDQQECER